MLSAQNRYSKLQRVMIAYSADHVDFDKTTFDKKTYLH